VLDEILVERPPKNGPAPVKFDRAAYWYDLREHEDERRSEASAYAKLTADAREDVILLEPFFAIAARVADMDRRRETVLAQATSSNPDERVHSRKRNHENTAIVGRVCRALSERMASYNYMHSNVWWSMRRCRWRPSASARSRCCIRASASIAAVARKALLP